MTQTQSYHCEDTGKTVVLHCLMPSQTDLGGFKVGDLFKGCEDLVAMT